MSAWPPHVTDVLLASAATASHRGSEPQTCVSTAVDRKYLNFS